jgi:hypothetical protein
MYGQALAKLMCHCSCERVNGSSKEKQDANTFEMLYDVDKCLNPLL